MARGPLPFKQADVLRAVKGARAAGMELGRVEIDPSTGRIVLVAAGKAETPRNDLDRWLEKRNA
ncbi:MAG TPA: hypothetical protein VNS02_10550 [Rhizobiaceae bacterium]|nr:hypothetical protein [Rhizobiaceae bacterium]